MGIVTASLDSQANSVRPPGVKRSLHLASIMALVYLEVVLFDVAVGEAGRDQDVREEEWCAYQGGEEGLAGSMASVELVSLVISFVLVTSGGKASFVLRG